MCWALGGKITISASSFIGSLGMGKCLINFDQGENAIAE